MPDRARFRLLRFRLTTYYVVIFGLLQVVLWGTVGIVLSGYLTSRFDQELLRRAQSIVEALAAAAKLEAGEDPQERFARAVEPFESGDSFILVAFSGQENLLRSANLRGARFPYSAPADRSDYAPRFTTLGGETSQALSGGKALRLLTLDVDEPPGPYYLQLATSLDPLQRVVGDIQRLLLVFVVVSLLIAAMTSWFVARRSLEPIERVTRDVRRISAVKLDTRIPAPRVADEVSEMISAINELLGRLETQFKGQQSFISDVAHELKTPLAVLLGECHSRRKAAAENPEELEFLEATEEELRRLTRVVESFLILTRARSARRMEVAPDVSVEDAILAAVQKSAREARQRTVQVVTRLYDDETAGEPIIRGDADLLAAMVENLITNALRHSPAGGVVEVEERRAPKEVRIIVRDQGPGIPEEHLQRIFEPYYQVTTSGELAGKAGIGLAIVKAVAELHGGRAAVRNREPGPGAEFTVRLPLPG